MHIQKRIQRLAKWRNLRTVSAVSLLISLLIVFYIDQKDVEEYHQSSLRNTTETNWRLSDVTVEILRTSQALEKLLLLNPDVEVATTTEFGDFLFRFELLWSNVDIALKSDLHFIPQFNVPLQSLQNYLHGLDAVLFADALPDNVILQEIVTTLRDFGSTLHQEWQNSYINQVFPKREFQQIIKSRAVLRERVIMVLIAILFIYLMADARIVSRAKRKEEELRAEAKAASIANEAKTRFLANVSHEIRTPLHGIIGMTNELFETPLNKDQRACLNVISQASELLLRNLNDILDLSKAEAGEFDLENTVFDLYETLDHSMALFSAKAREKNISLTMDRDSTTPRFVMGDAMRLSQVLHNLIGNAVKFTDHGGVMLRVKPSGEEDMVRFEVRDSGPGIAPEMHEKIFEPFSQADNSITRQKGGTGLGLAISRNLCEAMGGRIHISNSVSKGALFWFELPLRTHVSTETTSTTEAADHDGPHMPPAHEVPVERKQLLIVDDSPINRLLLKRFLKNTNFSIDEASNGTDAVKAAAAKAYDVILMDIQMPVMDGVVATKHIRSNEEQQQAPRTYIIAITANIMKHQIHGYMQEGIDEVLGKPLSKKDLLQRLNTLSTNVTTSSSC